MSDTDQIPDTFWNKTRIAEEYGMSRVTVNKHLKTLESSGRLIPKTVQQGNRKLYYYDPEDVKVAFSTLRSASNSIRNVQSRVGNSRSVLQSTDIELLKKDLETERRISSEKDRNIANLEKRVEELREDVNYFKAQLTDQRPNKPVVNPDASVTAEEVLKSEALPPEPPYNWDVDLDHPDNEEWREWVIIKRHGETRQEETERISRAYRERGWKGWGRGLGLTKEERAIMKLRVDAIMEGKDPELVPNVLDLDHPDHPDNKDEMKASLGRIKQSMKEANVVALKTAKEDKAIKKAEQEVREDIDDGTLEDVMEHFDPMNSAELALLDEEIEANKKAKDAEPAPQSNQTKEESKQPSEEATAKEERRNNITSKPEPAPVKKKRGLFGWLRDNW
tara:strand:+ start:161 stop:1336 length:1176 start_codon:yes stop_codon:yes gene_type:complete